MKTKKNKPIQFRCDSDMLELIDSLNMFKRSEAIRFLLKKAHACLEDEKVRRRERFEEVFSEGNRNGSGGQGVTA